MIIYADIKEMFFDRPAVTHKVDAAARKNLSKAGAFIRQTARRSLRYHRRMKVSEMPEVVRKNYQLWVKIAKRKGQPKPKRPWASSRPGEPPRVRPGSQLKSRLFFGYDSGSKTVVVGPEGFKKSTVPRVLEEGGATPMSGSAQRMLAKKGEKPRPRSATVRPRPYMQPAFYRELDNIKRLWQNSITG